MTSTYEGMRSRAIGCIVILRQTVSLYYNYSMWLDKQDAYIYIYIYIYIYNTRADIALPYSVYYYYYYYYY